MTEWRDAVMPALCNGTALSETGIEAYEVDPR